MQENSKTCSTYTQIYILCRQETPANQELQSLNQNQRLTRKLACMYITNLGIKPMLPERILQGFLKRKQYMAFWRAYESNRLAYCSQLQSPHG